MIQIAKKATLIALVAVLAVVLGVLRPGQPPERSDAGLISSSGIAALPSAMPATIPVVIPGLARVKGVAQVLPAIAPASGPGSFALVSAMCEGAACPLQRAGLRVGVVAPIEFTMENVFPPGQPVGATFTANGEQTLSCTDDTTCDLSYAVPEGAVVQHVAVGLTGGGVNEVINVTACDVTGDCRTVMVMFIETILALGVPAGIADAPAENPTIIAYRCEDVGVYEAPADRFDHGGAGALQGVEPISFEEIFNWFYGVPHMVGLATAQLRNPTTVGLPMPDIPFYSCGGDTPDNPVDDRVTFETDLGILSIEGTADGASMLAPGFPFRAFGTLTPGCDVGDSVTILDHPGPVVATRGSFGTPGFPIPTAWCDLDFAPNGVVSYMMWGMGEPGVATVTVQQSGGGGVLRTAYPTLTGLAALTIVLEGPEVIGLEGGTFGVALLDPGLRPVAGETIQCSAEPRDAVLSIIPQTATSRGLASPDGPYVNFTVFPTRTAVETGVDVTITCFLDSNPDVKIVASARIGKRAETVEIKGLEEGCSPLSSTWPDGTDIEDVVGAVAPAKALTSIWQLADPATGTWLGWAADVPAEENDLTSVNFLDSLFFCVSGDVTVTRPLVGAPSPAPRHITGLPDVPDRVRVGEVYTTAVSYTNDGLGAATDLVITSDLPSEVSWQDNVEVEIVRDPDASISGIDCSSQPAVGDQDGTLVCTVSGTMTPATTLGEAAPGDEIEIRYDLQCETAGTHDVTVSLWAPGLGDFTMDPDRFSTVCVW